MIHPKVQTHIAAQIFMIIFWVVPATSTYAQSNEQGKSSQLPECRTSSFINSIAVSPDNQMVLTNWNTGEARLWDMKTGKSIHSFVNSASIDSEINVAFSPLGNIVATGDEHQAVLWDVQTGAKIHSFPREIDDKPFGTDVSFSSDGLWLFTSGYDGASLWDVKTGKNLHTFVGQQAKDANVSQYGHLSADDKYVLTTNKSQVNIWSATTGKKLHNFEGNVSGIFTPDTSSILTWRPDSTSLYGGELILWDINTFQEKRTFQTSSDYLKFSPDSKYFFESGNPVKLWETATGKTLVNIRYGSVIGFFSDNHLLLPYSNSNASSGRDNTLQIWDLDTQKTIQQIPLLESEISDYQLTHDGQYLVIANWNGELYLWSIEKQEQILKFC